MLHLCRYKMEREELNTGRLYGETKSHSLSSSPSPSRSFPLELHYFFSVTLLFFFFFSSALDEEHFDNFLFHGYTKSSGVKTWRFVGYAVRVLLLCVTRKRSKASVAPVPLTPPCHPRQDCARRPQSSAFVLFVHVVLNVRSYVYQSFYIRVWKIRDSCTKGRNCRNMQQEY